MNHGVRTERRRGGCIVRSAGRQRAVARLAALILVLASAGHPADAASPTAAGPTVEVETLRTIRRVDVADVRKPPLNALGVAGIGPLVEDGLRTAGLDIAPDDEAGLVVTLRVEYFGCFKTEAGKDLGRAFLGLTVSDACARAEVFSERCTSEMLLKLHGSRQEKDQQVTASLSTSAVTEVLRVLQAHLASYHSPCQSVVASASATMSGDQEECRHRAVLLALRAACEKAWGVDLFSETTVRDLADVTDVVKTRANGRVVQHQILEESMGEDSTACKVKLRAVLLMPH
jgi:hypothetical protein